MCERAYSLRVQETTVGFLRDTAAAPSRGTPTMIGATTSTSEGIPSSVFVSELFSAGTAEPMQHGRRAGRSAPERLRQQRTNRRLVERLGRVGTHRAAHEDRIQCAERAFSGLVPGASMFRHAFPGMSDRYDCPTCAIVKVTWSLRTVATDREQVMRLPTAATELLIAGRRPE